MANAGVNHATFNWQLYLQLRHQFPEVPEGFVQDCLKKYKNDEQRCVDLLREESERRLYEQPTAHLEQAMNSVQLTDARRRNSFSHMKPVPQGGRVPDGLASQHQFPHSNSTPSLNVDYRPPNANATRRYTGAQTAPVVQQGAPTFYNTPYSGSPYNGVPLGTSPGYGVPQMQNWIGNQGYPVGGIPPPGRPHSADSSNTNVTTPLYINIGEHGYIPGEPYEQVYRNLAPGGGSGRSSPAVPALQHQLSSASQYSASSATHRQLSRSSTGSRHSGHSDDIQVASPVLSIPQYVGPPPRPSVLDLSVVPFYLNEDMDNTTPGEDPAYVRALVSHQRSRMDHLFSDINVLRSKIAHLQQDIARKERQLLDRGKRQMSQPKATASVEEIKKLRETNRSLSIDIQYMTREIDLYTTGQLPLGIIDPAEQQNFFRHMLNTGQTGPVPPPSVSPPSDVPPVPPRVPLKQTTHRPPPPPPRPPPPAEDEGRQWSCSYCTFSNHPALDKCEMCEMPKPTAPVAPPVASRPPAGPARPLSAPATSTSSYAPPVGSSHYLQLPPGYAYPPVSRSTSHPPPSYTVMDPSGHLVDGSAVHQPTDRMNPAPPARERMLCTRSESGEWELVNP